MRAQTFARPKKTPTVQAISVQMIASLAVKPLSVYPPSILINSLAPF